MCPFDGTTGQLRLRVYATCESGAAADWPLTPAPQVAQQLPARKPVARSQGVESGKERVGAVSDRVASAADLQRQIQHFVQFRILARG